MERWRFKNYFVWLLKQFQCFVHNKNLTHFSKIHHDSCIDHIFSNCSTFLTPVITDIIPHRDHAIFHCTHPKFAFLCPYHKLTTNKLTQHIKNCPQLNAIFTTTNPNTIAHELILNINSIIELIAPLKKVHFKKDYIKYYDQQIRDDLKHQKLMLQNAINTNDPSDWREFRNFKNTLSKRIKIKKRAYTQDKFLNPKDKWKLFK